jgi:hypothetical protein
MRNKSDPRENIDVKAYVIKAIAQEELYPDKRMWQNEPTAEEAEQERFKRIRFLRKFKSQDSRVIAVIKRLQNCELQNRCCSAACPVCSRLFQRWFVRRSKRLISNINNGNQELVAVCIVPRTSMVKPGELNQFSIANMQRRLKSALRVNIVYAIGGVDFSYNEDQEIEYNPFWCPHGYLITTTDNPERLGAQLRKIFKPPKEIPKPVFVNSFDNTAYRRSYALKMLFSRRIGYRELKVRPDGDNRKCRNTREDGMRSAERIELFMYLNKTGLAERIICLGAKPVASTSGVELRRLIDDRIR